MHDFPMPHPDLLGHVIDYRLSRQFDELATYDGSVIVERTKGELSARCHKEEANFLALDVAHDVLTGKRTIEEAQRFYAETVEALLAGEKPPYTQWLQFPLPQDKTEDTDRPAMPVPQVKSPRWCLRAAVLAKEPRPVRAAVSPEGRVEDGCSQGQPLSRYVHGVGVRLGRHPPPFITMGPRVTSRQRSGLVSADLNGGVLSRSVEEKICE